MEETKNMYPLWNELREMKNRLVVLELRAKRLEREIRILEIGANEYEKQALLCKTMLSIFGEKRNSDNPVKNK